MRLVKIEHSLCELCGKTNITTFGLCSDDDFKGSNTHLKLCSGCLPKLEEAADKVVKNK